MEEKRRGPGRPKSEQPTKDKRVSFRMEMAAYEYLKEFSSERGLTVAEAINKGIELYYQSESK